MSGVGAAPQDRAATLGGMAAILLWSATIALSRSLSESLGPIGAGAAACGFAGLLAAVFNLRHLGQRRGLLTLPRRYLLVCGLLFVSYTWLLYMAVGLCTSREQVLVVGLINYLWPVLTLLLSLPLLGRRSRWLLWPGTLLAFAGIVLVMVPRGRLSWLVVRDALAANPLVFLMALAAALSWALYSNLTRRWAGGSPRGGTSLFLLATALMLGTVAAFADEPRRFSPTVILEAAFLGSATYLGYTLWDRAMRKGHMILVTSFSYLTPLFSTLVSALYLGVVPGMGLWLGCLLLVGGSLLSWVSLSEA